MCRPSSIERATTSSPNVSTSTVSSFGSSESDALGNLREALELYFEDAPADAIAKVEAPEVRRLTFERA